MIPSFQIWNAASSCFPCIESMLSYRSTPPATNSSFLRSGTSFLIHPECNLEPSGTIWNHLDPNMEPPREEPSWTGGNIRATLHTRVYSCPGLGPVFREIHGQAKISRCNFFSFSSSFFFFAWLEHRCPAPPLRRPYPLPFCL